MKKLLLLIFTILIMSQTFISCSSNKNLNFKEFYSQIIGFDENDEKSKSIEKDKILIMTNEDFQQFKDEYFTSREIFLESPDKEKAVLYLQIPSVDSSVNTYTIQSMNVKNDTLTVNLQKSGVAQVDGINGFNGTWKWVMFIELGKTDLKDNMAIIVNKLN